MALLPVLALAFAGVARPAGKRPVGKMLPSKSVLVVYPHHDKDYTDPTRHYYAQPFDPRHREPEHSATFAPQLRTANVSSARVKRLTAAQGLKTINDSTAMRIKDRLESTGCCLPLLDLIIDDDSVNRLVESTCATRRIAANGTSRNAEEFFVCGRRISDPVHLPEVGVDYTGTIGGGV